MGAPACCHDTSHPPTFHQACTGVQEEGGGSGREGGIPDALRSWGEGWGQTRKLRLRELQQVRTYLWVSSMDTCPWEEPLMEVKGSLSPKTPEESSLGT